MDQGTDQGMYSGDDGRWLTYRELAEIRQVDRHSAVKLALGKGWRRQKDNRNVLRVLVPSEWLAPRAKGIPQGMARSVPEGTDQGMEQGTDLGRAITALEAAVTTLREQLTAANARADRLDALLTTAQGATTAIEAKLTAAEAARVATVLLAADLQVRFERAQAEAAAALQRSQELEAAEAARQARGLMARLSAAWRRE